MVDSTLHHLHVAAHLLLAVLQPATELGHQVAPVVEVALQQSIANDAVTSREQHQKLKCIAHQTCISVRMSVSWSDSRMLKWLASFAHDFSQTCSRFAVVNECSSVTCNIKTELMTWHEVTWGFAHLECEVVCGRAPDFLLTGEHVDRALESLALQLVQLVVLGQEVGVLARLFQRRLQLNRRESRR